MPSFPTKDCPMLTRCGLADTPPLNKIILGLQFRLSLPCFADNFDNPCFTTDDQKPPQVSPVCSDNSFLFKNRNSAIRMAEAAIMATRSSSIITMKQAAAPIKLTHPGILKLGRKSEPASVSMAQVRFRKPYVMIKKIVTTRA